MAEKQETADDIIAEMLGARTEFPFVYLMGEPDTPEVIDPKTKKIIEPRKINIRRVTVKELADRLKAALRRERGDCAKLREAAVTVYNVLEKLRPFSLRLGEVRHMREFSHLVCLAKNRLDAALSAPPRSCDVGTADDWMARFSVVCERCSGSDCDHRLFKDEEVCDCFARWLQMPYVKKEGGAKC